MWRSGKDVGTSTFILPLFKVKRGKGWIAWDDDDDDDNDDEDDDKSFVLMGWIHCFHCRGGKVKRWGERGSSRSKESGQDNTRSPRTEGLFLHRHLMHFWCLLRALGSFESTIKGVSYSYLALYSFGHLSLLSIRPMEDEDEEDNNDEDEDDQHTLGYKGLHWVEEIFSQTHSPNNWIFKTTTHRPTQSKLIKKTLKPPQTHKLTPSHFYRWEFNIGPRVRRPVM